MIKMDTQQNKSFLYSPLSNNFRLPEMLNSPSIVNSLSLEAEIVSTTDVSYYSWIDKASSAIGTRKTANQWRLPVGAKMPCPYLKPC